MDPWPEQNTDQGMYPTSDVTNHIEVRGAFFWSSIVIVTSSLLVGSIWPI